MSSVMYISLWGDCFRFYSSTSNSMVHSTKMCTHISTHRNKSWYWMKQENIHGTMYHLSLLLARSRFHRFFLRFQRWWFLSRFVFTPFACIAKSKVVIIIIYLKEGVDFAYILILVSNFTTQMCTDTLFAFHV